MLKILDGTPFEGQCPEGGVGECPVPVNPGEGQLSYLTEYSAGAVPSLAATGDLSASLPL